MRKSLISICMLFVLLAAAGCVYVGRDDAIFKRWVSVLFEDERVSEIIDGQELNPDL
jgi:hypothetical protein